MYEINNAVFLKDLKLETFERELLATYFDGEDFNHVIIMLSEEDKDLNDIHQSGHLLLGKSMLEKIINHLKGKFRVQ